MSITLSEVLPLEAFKHFRLIAGEKGLGREITSVGMLDYEVNEIIEQNFKAGEFVITTLVAIKEDLSQLEEMVARLIKVKSSGFAIKTIYINEVPKSVLDLCEREAYPLFLFEETFFEVIVTSVNDVLRAQSEMEDLEIQIDRMLSGDMNKYGIRRAAQILHRSFLEYVQVVFIKWDRSQVERPTPFLTLNFGNLIDRSHKCLAYKEGYLLIVSSNDREHSVFEHLTQHALSQLGLRGEGIQGFSGYGLRIDKLDVAIQEALYAYETARLYRLNQLAFEEMGLERLLLPIKDNPWVMTYYESIMEPLMSYDQKNGTDLLRTAVVFVLSGGDIKRSAERLFQHGNTVRYRMERIRQLLSEGKSAAEPTAFAFYEMLAVAVRLHLIYTGSL